jgi:uncharacterized coiled-coil protein SlyX
MNAQINAELLTWANQALHPWQQEAFRRLLLKPDLTEEDKAGLFQRALIDHGFTKPAHAVLDLSLTVNDLPSAASVGESIHLVGLHDARQVNALKAGQHISFGKQLTVVFGDNAFGKSGYARLMKAACAAKAVEDLLPDVFASSAPGSPAAAEFEIAATSVAQAPEPPEKIHWEKDKPPEPRLRRFRVFDCKCGKVYINEGNQVSFAPPIFDVLQKLGSVTQDIKQRLANLSTQLAPKPDALSPLIDDTSIGKTLAGLTANSDPSKITQLAQWDENDTATLKSKNEHLISLRATSPERIRRDLEATRNRLDLVKKHIKEMDESIADASVEKVKATQGEVQALEQASKAAAQLAFGDVDLAGIGSAAWKELILAAARYSTTEAYPGQGFPPTQDGARCVLCLQPLSAESRNRLKSFWDFLQDETSQKRDLAQQALDEFAHTYAQLPHALPLPIQAVQDSLRQSHPKLTDHVRDYFANAVERLKTIEAAINMSNWTSISPSPSSPVGECDHEIQAINGHLSEIAKDNQKQVLINDLSNEVAELQARQRLSQNLKIVTDHLTSLRASAAASLAANSINTYTISTTAKDLHKRFVTQTFVNSIEAELKSLGVRRAKAEIDDHSEYGKVIHRIKVGKTFMPVPPESIFSEGERTALALACFFADLGSVEEACGIVLDDPLTSLDHRVRGGLVKRIVQEAKIRQVVVFTHDLPFYCELLRAAEAEPVECHVQHIESFGTNVGLVSDSEPWDALKVNQRMSRMEQLINQAEAAENNADGPRLLECADMFYRQLRSTWERAVEELLFNRVVERYDRDVKTLRLGGVVVDIDGLTAIHEGMTRCSKYIHDQPPAANFPVPSSSEMCDDLRRLKEFAESQSAKRKAASMMASALSSTMVRTRPPHRAGGGVKGERSEFIADP